MAEGRDDPPAAADAGRPARGLRRATASVTLLLIAGVSAIAWRGVGEDSTKTLGNGATWAIWSGAVVLACLLAALVFRRERELRIGVLQGSGLGVLAVLVILWVGVAAGS